jgi:hypothetical protein
MLWDRKNVWEKNWLQNGGQKKVRYFKKSGILFKSNLIKRYFKQ